MAYSGNPTVKNFRTDMLNVSEFLKGSLEEAYSRQADELMANMRANVPEDTGALKRSIRKKVIKGRNRVSVLVAAGGLAAALSTADGLLLTIGNALAHDVYFEGNSNKAEAMRRVMLSKFALLVVALMAAYAAAQRPAGILYLVSASFSLAGAAFVPAMVLGIFWKRMTRSGAVAGMLAGLGTTVVYMVLNFPVLRQWFGFSGEHLWFGIQPVSAGVFGVPVGVLVAVIVSLLSSPDSPDERDFAPPLG